MGPTVPEPLQSRLTYQRFSMSDTALGFFLESFQAARQRSLCCGIHAINKQNPIEMIAFMLNRPRKKSACFNFECAAFQSLRVYDYRLRPFDLAGDFRKA